MIYLMRHGADAPDRYGGWSDFGLTDVGKEQVCEARLQLLNKGITEIYSSDLARAKETAQLDIIKVLTGIRRGGKSVLLEQIRDEINSPNTIFLNFEDLGNRHLCTDRKSTRLNSSHWS